MGLSRVRELLVEIAQLEPGDVAGFGSFSVFTDEAAELIDAIEVYETMRLLTNAGQIHPNIFKLLQQSATVETLQILVKQGEPAGG